MGNRLATTKNSVGIPTCPAHKELTKIPNCPICNMQTDVKSGKFGVFYECYEHGTFSMIKIIKNVKSMCD